MYLVSKNYIDTPLVLKYDFFNNCLILVWISEAVGRPQVWLDGSPVVTCQGQAVLLRCQTDRGTNVKYSWSREARNQDVLLQSSADLLFRYAFLTEDAQYICSAQNTASREQSKPISLHLLQSGRENCIYSLSSDGQFCTLLLTIYWVQTA